MGDTFEKYLYGTLLGHALESLEEYFGNIYSRAPPHTRRVGIPRISPGQVNTGDSEL